MAAVEWNTWAIVYLVLLIAAAATLATLLIRAARRPAPPEAPVPVPGAEPVDAETLAGVMRAGGSPEPFLAQWVLDERGEKLGETIGVDAERVILKRPSGFAAIPAAKVRAKGGLLVADRDVDWDEAARLGEAWRAGGAKPLEYDEHGMPKK